MSLKNMTLNLNFKVFNSNNILQNLNNMAIIQKLKRRN